MHTNAGCVGNENLIEEKKNNAQLLCFPLCQFCHPQNCNKKKHVDEKKKVKRNNENEKNSPLKKLSCC